MGTAVDQQREKWITLGQKLFRPMLAASVLLHAILLTLPLFPPQAEPEPEPEPEEEEIQLSSLTPLSRPSPPPSPVPSPPPQPKVPPPQAAAPPPPAPRPSPIPTPQPASTPQASPQPSPSPVATPSPTPTQVAQEEQQLQDYLGQFQGDLQGVAAGETAGLGIPYYDFPQPELIFTPESLAAANADPTLEAVPIAGVENILWASRRRPDEVLSTLQNRFEGFTFTPVQPYGGGEVYEVKKGATVRYLNLIRGTSRTATFVVIWTQNPSVPAGQSPVPAASATPSP